VHPNRHTVPHLDLLPRREDPRQEFAVESLTRGSLIASTDERTRSFHSLIHTKMIIGRYQGRWTTRLVGIDSAIMSLSCLTSAAVVAGLFGGGPG
jgi:hypothetical protein